MGERILRIRAVMSEDDMRVALLNRLRPRLRGNGLRVEVLGPDGEVIGLLAASAIHIECSGRAEPIIAHVTVDVGELDLLAIEGQVVEGERRS